MRRTAEKAMHDALRHQARLERRVRRLCRLLADRPPGRGVRRRRTWLAAALETTALPAHRWEALKTGGMIR